jgi:hypothetical protein
MLAAGCRFAAVLLTGLLAGILFGDRMGASLVRPHLAAAAFVQFQQGLHLAFVPLLPVLMGLAMVGGGAWLVSARARARSREFRLVALAVLGVFTVFVLTRTVNVPINEQLMTWSAASPPADLLASWRPWEIAHTVRTVIAVTAFALHLVALLVREP